jgi:hypothetical protein
LALRGVNTLETYAGLVALNRKGIAVDHLRDAFEDLGRGSA